MNIKIILICICVILSFSLYSQTNTYDFNLNYPYHFSRYKELLNPGFLGTLAKTEGKGGQQGNFSPGWETIRTNYLSFSQTFQSRKMNLSKKSSVMPPLDLDYRSLMIN